MKKNKTIKISNLSGAEDISEDKDTNFCSWYIEHVVAAIKPTCSSSKKHREEEID